MKKISTTDIQTFLTSIHGKLEVDVLAETWAELLIQSGQLDEEQIHILPKNQFRRNYSNDITETLVEDDVIVDDEYEYLLKIFTSRSTIIDNLPESFYTDPHEEKEREKRNEEDLKDYQTKERDRKKQILESARRFFNPLEVAYNRVRVARELKEVILLQKFDKLLRQFWQDIPDNSPAWNRFLRTLHLVSYIVGDKDKTRNLIEFVLGKPIEFSDHIQQEEDLPQEFQRSMGSLGLGFDFNVGNVFPCYIRTTLVTIKELNEEELSQYLNAKSDSRKLLEEIEKYYFPLDTDVKFEFKIQPEKEKFSFGGETAQAVLGYSTKI